MTKREIAKELANRSNLTPSQATHAVEGIVEPKSVIRIFYFRGTLCNVLNINILQT